MATFHSSAEAVNGYGVSVRYQSSDFATTSTLPSTGSPTSIAPPIPTNPSSSGLSTGAKAGIGAGIGAVAVIAVIGLAIYLVLRRQRRVDARQETRAKKIDTIQPAPVEVGTPLLPKTTAHEVYTLPVELVGDDGRR